MINREPDYTNAKGYADAWGFRLGSAIANLIDYLREEYRDKYACDYRFLRVGKNKFKIIPGDCDSGFEYVVEHVEECKHQFKTTVVV